MLYMYLCRRNMGGVFCPFLPDMSSFCLFRCTFPEYFDVNNYSRLRCFLWCTDEINFHTERTFINILAITHRFISTTLIIEFIHLQIYGLLIILGSNCSCYQHCYQKKPLTEVCLWSLFRQDHSYGALKKFVLYYSNYTNTIRQNSLINFTCLRTISLFVWKHTSTHIW